MVSEEKLLRKIRKYNKKLERRRQKRREWSHDDERRRSRSRNRRSSDRERSPLHTDYLDKGRSTLTVKPTKQWHEVDYRVELHSHHTTRQHTTHSVPREPGVPATTTGDKSGRFGKPSTGRKTTAGSSATSEASTPSAPVEKPVTQPKAFGRRGLFAGRTRPSSTTAAPASDDAGSAPASSEAPAPRPRLRPGLRRGPSSTSTTAVTSSAGEDSTLASGSSGEISETTPTPSRNIGRGRPGLRPASLRPGPRLNLRPNPRLRGVSTAPEAASESPAETSAPESPATDAEAETSSLTPAPETPRSGLRVRNRLQVSPSPKPRAPVTQPARRVNPLLKRKLASTEATTEAPKKSTETTEESATSAEKSETETEPAPAETTAAPPLRGLDALIAKRRAAGGIGGRPARPARGAYNPK